jgi:hypothetical protein
VRAKRTSGSARERMPNAARAPGRASLRGNPTVPTAARTEGSAPLARGSGSGRASHGDARGKSPDGELLYDFPFDDHVAVRPRLDNLEVRRNFEQVGGGLGPVELGQTVGRFSEPRVRLPAHHEHLQIR